MDPNILPRMSVDEALEVTKIYSVAGLLASDTPLMRDQSRGFQVAVPEALDAI